DTSVLFYEFDYSSFIITKKKEDISGNLCPPVYYSHSPMKKNNYNILVQKLIYQLQKPVL
ncbi:MAG: hypothetical protein ACC651_17125, partial [Candidatus Scalindua sp.]